MSLINQPGTKIASLVGKMAGHIKANEARIEQETRILKRTEKIMRGLDDQRKKYHYVLRHHEKEMMAMEQQAKSAKKEPRLQQQLLHQLNVTKNAIKIIHKNIAHVDAMLHARSNVFQQHMLLKTGLEKSELQLIANSKVCLDIIERRKVTGTTHDIGVVSAAASRHELSKTQKHFLVKSLEHIYHKAHLLEKYERSMKQGVRRAVR